MAKIVKQKHGGSLKILEKGETANKNGRPRKLVNETIHNLREQGITEISAEEVRAVYLSLLNTDEEELTRLATDLEQPMLVRIAIANILSKKGYEIMEKMLDRSLGKAQLHIDHTTLGEKIISEVNINIIDGTDGYQPTETLQEADN